MQVIESRRRGFKALVAHRFKLDDIERAYDLFSNQRDGVLKVAITLATAGNRVLASASIRRLRSSIW